MPLLRLQGQSERMRGVRYEVDTDSPPLGIGGMGKVFQGQQIDEMTGATRPVAIKFLFEDLSSEAIEKSRREASIHLQNDNLIEMLGFIELEGKVILGERQKLYYVVSELLWGVSLYDLMKGVTKDFEGNTVPYAEKMLLEYRQNPYNFAKIIVNEVLLGLIALHNAGYIHRDIDPSNIMLTKDEKVKLIDFGVAKKIKNLGDSDRLRTSDGVFIGKAEYASPELVLGDVAHQKQTADIYAVGILLFQCVTGHVPFKGDIATVLEAQLKKTLPIKEVKNKYIREIISKATQKKQKDRFQSSAEMLVAIEHLPAIPGSEPFDVKKLLLVITFLLLLGGGWLVVSYITPSPPIVETEVTDSPRESEKTEKELLDESIEMLKDESRAQKGLEKLEYLSEKKQYGQATFLLSRLYYKKETDDGIWLPQYAVFEEMQKNSKVKVDNRKAHELLEKAITKENCYDCWAYLEMGLDYSLAQYRSSEYVKMLQDDNYDYTKTAKEYLVEAYDLAIDSLNRRQGDVEVQSVKEVVKKELRTLLTFMVRNKVITRVDYDSFLNDSRYR